MVLTVSLNCKRRCDVMPDTNECGKLIRVKHYSLRAEAEVCGVVQVWVFKGSRTIVEWVL